MIYSSNVLKRWSFLKKSRWNMIFLPSSGKITFLFPENMIFCGRKIKDDLSQKIHGNTIFYVCSVKMVLLFHANMKLPFCQKNRDDLFPKNTPKDDISILDRYSRNSFNDSLYFYGDLSKCFHILFSYIYVSQET